MGPGCEGAWTWCRGDRGVVLWVVGQGHIFVVCCGAGVNDICVGVGPWIAVEVRSDVLIVWTMVVSFAEYVVSILNDVLTMWFRVSAFQ